MTYDTDDQEWQEEFREFEGPESEMLPCPSCGAEVYEETQRCPHCGDWIMPLAGSTRRKRRVWIIAALLAIIAILAFVIG